MDEMTAQPITRELIMVLTNALETWVNANYKRNEKGIELAGTDIDFILNAIIIFSAAKVAMVHKQILSLNILREEAVDNFNETMLQAYTDHFNRVLIGNMTRIKEDEQPVQ